MQPSTSYWPSFWPGRSFGVKSKWCPHLAQNPSTRPGLPSRPRPTLVPHLLQNRLFSGTCGLVSTASRGSRLGTGAMSTIPRPSRPRLVDRVDPRRDRVAVVPVGDVHAVTAVGRLDVRVDGVDTEALLEVLPVDVLPAAGGSRPHVSQKPSS